MLSFELGYLGIFLSILISLVEVSVFLRWGNLLGCTVFTMVLQSFMKKSTEVIILQDDDTKSSLSPTLSVKWPSKPHNLLVANQINTFQFDQQEYNHQQLSPLFSVYYLQDKNNRHRIHHSRVNNSKIISV